MKILKKRGFVQLGTPHFLAMLSYLIQLLETSFFHDFVSFTSAVTTSNTSVFCSLNFNFTNSFKSDSFPMSSGAFNFESKL